MADRNQVVSGQEQLLSFILEQAPVLRVEDVPALLRDLCGPMGAEELIPYVVDYHQNLLVPLVDERSAPRERIGVDNSLAGRCFRNNTTYTAESEPRTIWVPMLDDTERLGVLEVHLAGEPTAEEEERLLRVAALLARVIATRAATGDRLEILRRQLPMTVAAEMQWSLLPPLTMATRQLSVCGILEPCYDIGGDSFDYATNGDTLHIAVFDAMGHGLEAAQLASLTVAAYRNARRSGLGLDDTFRSLDRFVSSQFPDRFVTAVLAEMDINTGVLDTISAGHPAALLFRNRQLVKKLGAPTAMPLGLGDVSFTVEQDSLEPGDRLLVYTDGIVEARMEDGEEFGVVRLQDFMTRQLSAEVSGSETMRGLLRELLEHQHDELQDDASAVLLEWGHEHPPRLVP